MHQILSLFLAPKLERRSMGACACARAVSSGADPSSPRTPEDSPLPGARRPEPRVPPPERLEHAAPAEQMVRTLCCSCCCGCCCWGRLRTCCGVGVRRRVTPHGSAGRAGGPGGSTVGLFWGRKTNRWRRNILWCDLRPLVGICWFVA